MATGNHISAPEEQIVRVGAIEIVESQALEIVRIYTAESTELPRDVRDYYAWPYYDFFASGSMKDELNDGDLLAPLLLNVNPRIHGFAALQESVPLLAQRLAVVADDIDLADATDTEIQSVGELFKVLDERRLLGVSGTTLSKVLHRKRPRLVPLHDRFVNEAYVPDRVARRTNRPWSEYIKLLMYAMRDDLNREVDAWDRIVAVAPSEHGRLTRLRALDIISWSRGKKS